MEKKNKFRISNNNLKDGQHKFLELDEKTPVILVKIDGDYHAFSGKCPHHNAEFEDGGLVEDLNVVCPWHHAKFSLTDGTLLNPPNLDNLEEFPISEDGDGLIIEVPEKSDSNSNTEMSKLNIQNDDRTFVIIGGGAAGNAAAETLRTEGFQGRIILINKEDSLPYDRTLLSKEYLESQNDLNRIPIRSRDFYKDNDIELSFNKTVLDIDTKNKKVILKDEEVNYDRLLIATGGTPVELDIPGSELKNIFYLRSLKDANRIIEAVNKVKSVTIIGASFIALECAASLRKSDLDVTVIAPEEIPFLKILGKELGMTLKKLHEENGVKFELNSEITAFEGDSYVEKVVLNNNNKIDAELVIAGIGIKPSTDFIPEKLLSEDGSIEVNSKLEVLKGDKSIFAAGDIASFPAIFQNCKESIRVEHWRVAEQHGQTAALNMLGKNVEFKSVPMFWTDQYDFSLNYTGHSENWERTIVDGDLEEEFIIYYLKNNKLCAAAGKWRDKDMCIIEESFAENKLPDTSLLEKESFSWDEWLSEIQCRDS